MSENRRSSSTSRSMPSYLDLQDEGKNSPSESEDNLDSVHFGHKTELPTKTHGEKEEPVLDATEPPDRSLVFNEEAAEMKEINRTFSKVMSDFEGDKSAERFMGEYEKLYQALVESHRQQRKYMLRCSNLQSDIKNNAEKVTLALHLSREDKEIINNLSQQVMQAWAEVDNLTAKERRAKQAIQNLQQEIHVLISMVESSVGIEELGKMADKTMLERVEVENAFTDMKEELEFREIKIHEVQDRLKMKEEAFTEELKTKDGKIHSLGEKNKEISQKMGDLDASVKKLEAIRVNILNDNAQLVAEGESHSKKMRSVEQQIKEFQKKLEDSIRLYRKQKADSLAKAKELVMLSKEIGRMNRIIETHHGLLENLNGQLLTLRADLGITQKDLQQKQIECSTLNKKLSIEVNLKERFKNEVLDREHLLKMDRGKLSHLQTELITTKRQIDSLTQRLQNLVRVNEAASRLQGKLVQKNKELESAVSLQTAANNEMMTEINVLTGQMKSAVACINSLGVDKQKLFDRISQAVNMIHKFNAEIDTKDNLLLNLDKLNQELVVQLKSTKNNLVHMTNSCDNVKNELHFSELKNEDLFNANANFNKQASSLAEDLVIKEREISKLNLKVENLKTGISKQQTEMADVVRRHDDTKQLVTETENKLYQLEKILCEKDGRIRELNIDIEKLIGQRNIVSLQCIRKMEEVNFLTDKNAVLEDIVKKGNDQYNQRLNDIKHLKFEILSLNRQKRQVMSKLECVQNLRLKLGLANQQLVAAKARYRALEGEHPYNLHRWRHLEAKEISQYEMVIKIHFLLKRLIAKTDEVTRLEGIINEKTFLLHEMQKILKRRPSADAIRNANLQAAGNINMKRKVKAILAEKNLAQWQIDEQVKEGTNLRKKLQIEQEKSINLQKSKQKLLTITSQFPGISKFAETSSKIKCPVTFKAEFGDMKNFLPKV